MKTVYRKLTLVIAIFLYGIVVLAQVKQPKLNVDTLKDRLKSAITIDTAKLNKINTVDDRIKAAVNEKLKQSALSKALYKDSTIKARKKIELKDFMVDNTLQYVATQGVNPLPNYLNRLSFSGQLEIYQVPINLELVNNYNPLNNFKINDQSLFKFDMAKQQFQQLYEADLNKYQNLKDKKFLGQSAQNYLKKGIQDQIQAYLPSEVISNPKLMAYLNNPDAMQELLTLNQQQVEAKLTNVLTNLQAELKNKGETFYANERDSLNLELNKKVKEIAAHVETVKQELNENGLDEKKIALLEKVINKQIGEKELEMLFINELSQQPDLQELHKLYTKISSFKAGNFGSILPGSYLNPELFLNGVSFSIKTQRGPISLGIATNKDIGLPKDQGFNRSTFANPRLLTHVSIPTTNFSFGSGKLSWVGQYDKQLSSNSNLLSTAIPKNNMVFTATQNVNFNDLGKLTIAISKSSIQYKNVINGTDQLMLSSTTMGNYFRDDFLETMSLGLNHGFESRKMGLNSNVYFSYSGIGFQNPAQQVIGNMNMRFGGNIKKNFLRNKVTLYVKSDLKNTPISAENNAHWRNYNIQFDSRIRLSKSYTLSFKYIENGVDKINTKEEGVYAGQKLQADFNASYKLGGRYSFSHISVGRQIMDNMAIATIATPKNGLQPNLAQNSFLLANYVQTVVFPTFSLNGNVFYNKQLTSNTLLGDMLNADLACQYSLFKSVSVSSGITYLNNEGIAKQIGLRQNVQMMIKKHFDVNAYLDFRKNLINPLYPDLFATGRAEVSLRYYLDKQ
jgi:hypothetical protein